MRLSKNFWLSEMVKSNFAKRLKIDNTPPTEAIVSLTALATTCLQPIRDVHGVVSISSGYRCAALNKACNSGPHSQHILGEAADFECNSVDNKVMAQWISNNLPVWDDLILEYYEDGDSDSGWLHISFKRDGSNRKRVRKAVIENGKTVYKDGF